MRCLLFNATTSKLNGFRSQYLQDLGEPRLEQRVVLENRHHFRTVLHKVLKQSALGQPEGDGAIGLRRDTEAPLAHPVNVGKIVRRQQPPVHGLLDLIRQAHRGKLSGHASPSLRSSLKIDQDVTHYPIRVER